MGKIFNIIKTCDDYLQAEAMILHIIDKLVPKRYDSDPPQDKYEEGQECAYRIIEKRISKLKNE